MCGIAGFILNPDEKVDAKVLATELLLGIEHRGRDATGVGFFHPDKLPEVWVQKTDVSARDFVKNYDLPSNARNVILHTRFATQGHKSNNDNNHPIATGGIVGVHNGCVFNDDTLFRTMGIEDARIAEVDTEAIFAAIAYGQDLNEKGEPLLAKDLMGCLEKIQGSAAIAWQRVKEDPTILEVARISQSPVVWGQTQAGSFIFASTDWAIKAALRVAGLELADGLRDMSEGTYFKLRNGMIADCVKFTPARSYTSRTTSYSYSGGWGSDRWDGYGGYTDSRGSKEKRAAEYRQKADDRRYEEWLEKNTKYIAAQRQPVGGGVDDPQIDPGFEPFFSPTALHPHILNFLRVEPLPSMKEEDYGVNYREREKQIRAWAAGFVNVDEKTRMLKDAHANIRPGDWVETSVGTMKIVFGQVALVPNSFPYGEYLINAMIPNEGFVGGYEPVLVRKDWTEFVVVNGADNHEDAAIAAFLERKADETDDDPDYSEVYEGCETDTVFPPSGERPSLTNSEMLALCAGDSEGGDE